MRTQQEISVEIESLRALKPVGQFAPSTDIKIQLAIKELKYGLDDTAAEWDELDSSCQDVVMTTRSWKEGDSDNRPSEGWGLLVARENLQ